MRLSIPTKRTIGVFGCDCQIYSKIRIILTLVACLSGGRIHPTSGFRLTLGTRLRAASNDQSWDIFAVAARLPERRLTPRHWKSRGTLRRASERGTLAACRPTVFG